MTDQERYIEKVQKLLRKAESTTPEEAEALVEKAQELMTAHAINEAMLAHRRQEPSDRVGRERIELTGHYAKAESAILSAVARANNCRVAFSPTMKRDLEHIWINGFTRDVARTGMLFSSLLIQAHGAMWTWWKEEREVNPPVSRRDGYYSRRAFLFGFGVAVNRRLDAARVRVEEVLADEDTSVALVVRDRRTQVKDWVDSTYGHLTTHRVGASVLPGGAAGAGREAGERADIGMSDRVKGGGGELPA